MAANEFRAVATGLSALLSAGTLGAALVWAGEEPAGRAPIVDTFLAREDPAPVSWSARRRLEADCDRLGQHAWLEARTTLSPAHGFTYEVLDEGGSGAVLRKVLRPALERERQAWAAGDAQRALLTEANYVFGAASAAGNYVAIEIAPRRKDLLLLRGALIVTPGDADLVRIQAQPAKRPSAWTRDVHIVREYRRIHGVRVPVSMTSTANVLVAGRSTFSMTYTYTEVNGRAVHATALPVAGKPGT